MARRRWIVPAYILTLVSGLEIGAVANAFLICRYLSYKGRISSFSDLDCWKVWKQLVTYKCINQNTNECKFAVRIKGILQEK